MELPAIYQQYSVGEFICDEAFQNWALGLDPAMATSWEAWLAAHPDKQPMVEEARQFLTQIHFRIVQPDPARVDAKLQEALAVINAEKPSIPATIIRVLRPISIAAAVIGLVVLMIWLYSTQQRAAPAQQMFSTDFGKKDSLILPDQSKIILNANSRVRFSSIWQRDKPREVWLEGEALFDVQHLDKDQRISPGERFLVHAGPVIIEVLGTQFNIRQRRNKIEVALISGAVQVSFRHNQAMHRRLIPGQVLEIDTTQQTIAVNDRAQDQGSWAQNRLTLNNPTLKDITTYLEDIYGRKIILTDSKMAERRVEGPILLDSLDDALFILSTVLNVTISKEDDLIIIKPR